MHMYICSYRYMDTYICIYVHIYIWIHTYIYMIHKGTRKYYSDIKKNQILPFVTIWEDPEGIMLSEVSQTGKDEYCFIHLYVKSKKQMNKCN